MYIVSFVSGAEKVLALRGCLTFAELWYKSLSDDVSTTNSTTRNASVHMPAVDFV